MLRYIRFATYTVVLVCFIVVRPARFFIPVRLPFTGAMDADAFYDPRPFHGGYTPVALPGFADTRMSGSEVTKAAKEAASRDQVQVEQLKNLQITLAIRDHKLLWFVDWNLFDQSRRSFDYRVVVDDSTGRAWREERPYP